MATLIVLEIRCSQAGIRLVPASFRHFHNPSVDFHTPHSLKERSALLSQAGYIKKFSINFIMGAIHISGSTLRPCQAAAVAQPKRLGPNYPTSEKYRVLRCELKQHVLVVDDSVDIALMLVMILQRAGYDAVMAVSATDALALAQREQFDLVISDIGMPQMDGYDLARSLRALPEYASIPMVAITGYAQFDDRWRALAAGFEPMLRSR